MEYERLFKIIIPCVSYDIYDHNDHIELILSTLEPLDWYLCTL